VAPLHRGRGVAKTLVRHAVRDARRMGISRLYPYTAPARGLYEKLGWRPIAEETHAGQPITIMAIDVRRQ
jgi:GNAT superfamily N-acetyltransferase